MSNKLYVFCFLATFLIISCNSTKNIVKAPVEIREEMLDTLVVSAPRIDTTLKAEEEEIVYSLPKYNSSYKRTNDLIHTSLNLKFDWQNQYVIGSAELSFSPIFYPTNELFLDAKNFDIHSIKTFSKDLKYEYDGQRLSIQLDRAYASDEVYVINIEYTAKPNEGEEGGSAAITSDKGLFFINPDGKDLNKPQQIWTQGETENNSRWFPTIDKPNERCTQEIKVTVEDRFKTLSNGLLTSSINNADGTRTDIWKQDKPHAPYLFMLAIGEFAIVRDKWKNIPVDYYVEPAYEAYAKIIFNHTPEMIQFFSDKLNVDYPWDKYAQVIVRDYVSGAMENTSAVIFGDFVQKTEDELIDNSNDFIVAHELIHHWFGDMVTCESWANLTMNEGFANYGEYLWFEYKYGKDEADFHRQNELFGYLNQVQSGSIHPLIHFEHNNKEEMFDGHSYNKGGLVLHMLRKYLGDEAFYAGLHKYLTVNAYTAVEAHDLRLAMEDVSGEDLNWFFNQWFFDQGHPVLNYNYIFDNVKKEITLDIEQIQDPVTNPPIFVLPMNIGVYFEDGSKEEFDVLIDRRKQSFSFALDQEPVNLILDDNDALLCIISEEKSDLSYLNQLEFSSNYSSRLKAIQYFLSADSPLLDKALNLGLVDNHWSIRSSALSAVSLDVANRSQIINLASNDPNSNVRAAALLALSTDEEDHSSLVIESLNNERAPIARAQALKSLHLQNNEKAVEKANELKNIASGPLLESVAEILSATGDPVYISFFEEKIEKTHDFNIMPLIGFYVELIKSQEPSLLTIKSLQLKEKAVNTDNSMFKRYASAKGLFDLKTEVDNLRSNKSLTDEKKKEFTDLYQQLSAYIIEIKEKEKDTQLKNAYMFFN